MDHSLILAAAEGAEHTERVLLGLPTYWFGIIFGIIFLLMFLITLSFSGRGIIRASHGADRLDSDEQQAIKEYNSRHGR
ncbi:hypothetical protein [Rothia aerolata]|uniref:Uncharacterized protein n=1 Tax=Rothia aerolata TaxID=1812262 RepID=A0A917IMJ5_9MICC|nr:hypothetical protein [Rothia aerolata]GGH58093.1 hypothetical protein GCM10007359_03910 [Rothia aerolata]